MRTTSEIARGLRIARWNRSMEARWRAAASPPAADEQERPTRVRLTGWVGGVAPGSVVEPIMWHPCRRAGAHADHEGPHLARRRAHHPRTRSTRMTTESIIATIEFDQSGAPSDEAAAVATVEDILTAMRDGLAVMVQVESPDGGKNYFDVTSSPAGAYKAKRLGSNMGSRA